MSEQLGEQPDAADEAGASRSILAVRRTEAELSWSLDYHMPREPELLDEFFLALGKALYLASRFEAKCRWVLQIGSMATHLDAGGDWEAALELARALEGRRLGAAIKGLANLSEIGKEEIAELDRAREARNAIAHSLGNLGPVSSISARTLAEQKDTLRQEVAALIAGDNLVSRWCYEIEEKEPAPREIQKLYPAWVSTWLWERDGA